MSPLAPTGSPRSMPLRSALRDDTERTPPLGGQAKAVQIADPDVSAVQEAPPVPPVEDPQPRKQFPASVAAKRLSGRAAVIVPPGGVAAAVAPVLAAAAASSRASGAANSLEGLHLTNNNVDNATTHLTSSPLQLPATDAAGHSSAASSASPSLRPHAHPLQLHAHSHSHSHAHRARPVDPVSGRLLAQVAAWVEHEKQKRAARKARRVVSYGSRKGKAAAAAAEAKLGSAGTAVGHAVGHAVGSTKRRLREARGVHAEDAVNDDDDDRGNDDYDSNDDTAATAAANHHHYPRHHQRAPSTGSASSEVSLDRLQRILDDSMAALGLESPASLAASTHGGGTGTGPGSSNSSRRHTRALRHQLHRTASSDTDYVDGDVLVPSCDAVLDNSNTLKYAAAATAAAAESGAMSSAASDADSASLRREDKERQAWVAFKNEIIRLAHTLRLKGWRKVPLDAGDTIWVERLSGALTNAVYEVSPPTTLAKSGGSHPHKLLLRIYGPQVEHLIDRENELSVLRRLARKKIGPRLLGTFGNGRFEQFFTATTLTAASLREPDTSRQIAKRMRELHDGIALLDTERDAGPGVWRNWDRWLDTVERRIAYLDAAVAAAQAQQDHPPSPVDAWKARGFVCGVAWPLFKALVAKQRALVVQYYSGPQRIRDQLVFAHSDTQYGNILRLQPDEKSPLLAPANEHKQLIVIDFEYAGANPPGVEFANHFTEWTYNYHDATAPHSCQTRRYPTPEEQRRFLRAYIDHRPAFPHQGGGSTPRFGPTAAVPENATAATAAAAVAAAGTPILGPVSSASSIVDFMLDARAPPGGWAEEDRRRDDAVERQVDELAVESRLWRAGNSAQWVAWGIVQAKVAGMEDGDGDGDGEGEAAEAVAAAGGSEDEFDYLAYAQERALFFLGDCVQAGLVRLEELPADVRARVKMVEY